MAKVLLILSIVFVFARAPVCPYIGVTAYYIMAILGPQYIWWWAFDGLRVSLYIAIATICGVIFKIFNNKVDYSFLTTPMNFWMLVLWLTLNISYFFGPYVPVFDFPSLSPSKIHSITNNIFLFYFLSVLSVNRLIYSIYLSISFFVITVFMTYWANMQYFNQNWDQFNYGRLLGPRSVDGSSMYYDENALALLFVTGIPFIFYIALNIKNKLIKLLILSVIPFSAHAIFLTGSRGALLSLAVILIFISIKMKYKIFKILLPIMFIVFYQWQGGDIMHERSKTIVDHGGEGSAEGRIEAWKGGFEMVKSFPITGVGLGTFVTALPDFYPTNPRVAHNTLVQYSGESGALAGLSYVLIIFIFFKNSYRTSLLNNKILDQEIRFKLDSINNANTASFLGLTICSMFLSLALYEIFFFLLLINNNLTIFLNKLANENNKINFTENKEVIL